MSKTIVICMDGTWNDPSEQTNVYKLFDSLKAGAVQYVRATLTTGGYAFRTENDLTAFYLEGVGASGRKEQFLGGSTGFGLRERVLHAFILASVAYKPGDKFWIFGFSRGAWAARSLAGLIAGAGLMHPHDAESDEADLIAEKLWQMNKRGQAASRGNAFWGDVNEKPIKLVGVWDTVGALGIPFFNGIKQVDEAERQFLDFADLSLSDRVAHGRHALAIDERRVDFTPTLWNSRANVVQVWFSGGHADVGGGYPDACGLSDIALEWMAEQILSIDQGLPLDMAKLGRPNFMQLRHDESQKAIWHVRPIVGRGIPPDAQVHESVLSRLLELKNYRPEVLQNVDAIKKVVVPWVDGANDDLWKQNDVAQCKPLQVGESKDGLMVYASRCWNAVQLKVAQGERYRITATGEWWDADNLANADGYESRKLVLMEGIRRVPSAKWFSLIAAVHESPSLELRNPTAQSLFSGAIQSLVHSFGDTDKQSDLTNIGTDGELEVGKDGFLYLFANDAAFAYSNNHGALRVTVNRVQ
jgi:uncharacterized protein (DUF2235 family)